MQQAKYASWGVWLALMGLLGNWQPSPQYVGIPSEKMEGVVAIQEHSNWCWAACIQMIFQYNELDLSQAEIVRRSFGTDPYGNLPNWTGNFEVITRNLNGWNLDNAGAPYRVSSLMNWGAPPPAYLIDELTAERPVLVGYRTGPQSGHAVLITAASFIQTPQGPEIQSVVVRDPMPTRDQPKEASRYEYPAFRFAHKIQAYWFVQIERPAKISNP